VHQLFPGHYTGRSVSLPGSAGRDVLRCLEGENVTQDSTSRALKTSRQPPSRSIAVLALLFLGSGASALVYQVLWLRQLALIFGVTVHAATAVLAGFMAGLAIGSALAGRLADRTPSPLAWFGLVEVGVAVLALATHWMLPALVPLYVAIQAWLPDGAAVQTAVRFTGSLLVLLAPTTLMGMTLPLMLKAAGARGGNTGTHVSVLYATNAAGAVAGALLAGYVLVGSLGIASSFRLAAVVNAIVGLAALAIARAEGPQRAVADAPNHDVSLPAGTATPAPERPLPGTALAVFALSGFGALALEVVWFRVLVYFVPATTYAFSTMLAAVLLGLALGSYAATPLLGRADRLRDRFMWLQLAIALAVPLSAAAIARAYGAGWHTTADVHVSLLLSFPPAFLMGMAYPIGLRLWAPAERTHDAIAATRVGDLNAANLLGGIVGAATGGFLVLPLLGTRGGVIALAAVYLVTFVLVRQSRGGLRLGAVRAGHLAVAVAAFGVVTTALPDVLETASARRYPQGERPFWRQEGAQTTAAIRVRPDGGLVLYLDGLHQASDAPDMVWLHRMIGHLPMALHPNPKRAIVIGLGGGVTPGAVSQHEASVEVVELSPSVVQSADRFAHVNYRVTSRPNVRLRVDDGRNFLLERADRYDVITADLIQPEHAGAGHLYSREYFALMRRALGERGLALQWLGHRADVEYRLILRTFLDVFPETTLWADGQLLVGSLRPLVIHQDAFERKLRHETGGPALRAIGLDSFEALLRLYVAGPAELKAFAGAGALLTDDRPLIEYFRSLPGGARQMVDLSGLRGSVARHLP
jgi:spermidine synthase